MRHAFIAALLLASATALHAQTPPGEGGKGPMREHRMDCAKASDPAKCEERRAKMRDAHRMAEEACKGKDGADRRACMGQQMCAQAPDPAKCNERQKERAERHKDRAEAHHKAREACKGKEGDEMRKCMHEHRPPRPASKS